MKVPDFKNVHLRYYLLLLNILFIGFAGGEARSANAPADTAIISSSLRQAADASSDSAILLYKKAIQLTTENLKPVIKSSEQKPLLRFLVKGYLGLGLVYYQKIDYKEALAHYNSAFIHAAVLKEPYFMGDCEFYIAEVYLEQSRHSEAMQKYNAALVQYQKAKSMDGVYWCYAGMGIVQKQSGNFNDAILCYNKALKVAQEAGMKNAEAYCYNNLGNVYRKQGDFAKAMEAFQKAITKFNALNDKLAASDCLNNIGNLYLDNGDPFRALEYYNKSISFPEVRNDNYRMIIRSKNLADTYTELKDYENAEQFLDDATKLAEKAGDKSNLASCYAQYGKLHKAKGALEIAVAYHKKSASLFKESGARAEEAEAWVELAVTELQAELVNDAIAHAHAGEMLAKEVGALKTLLLANKCLADCYEKKGDPAKALNYLSNAMMLKDSVFNVEKNRTIEEIEAGFVQSGLKNENLMLAQNNLLQKQALHNRNLFLLLLAICLVLSIALAWLVYKRNLQTKKEAGLVKHLSDQKIEKLSEDIGGKDRELTSKTMLINQKNQLLEKLISELEQLKKSDVSSATIHNLQMELKQELSPNAWKEFELSFNEVHPGFQQRLLENYPELTPAERRLCSFVRLDMNTREISSLSGQSIKSIEVARTRIRKKLNIPHEHNLANFIASI
jgi:tetratricopeptide (TPR) repeat protein